MVSGGSRWVGFGEGEEAWELEAGEAGDGAVELVAGFGFVAAEEGGGWVCFGNRVRLADASRTRGRGIAGGGFVSGGFEVLVVSGFSELALLGTRPTSWVRFVSFHCPSCFFVRLQGA